MEGNVCSIISLHLTWSHLSPPPPGGRSLLTAAGKKNAKNLSKDGHAEELSNKREGEKSFPLVRGKRMSPALSERAKIMCNNEGGVCGAGNFR